MRDHQDPFLKEQDCKGLICCLEALQSLDLTYYSIQNKNKNPIILYLEKRKVSNLINVANYILHAASIHVHAASTHIRACSAHATMRLQR